MCAPRVVRHTSIRCSSSCHTRVNICASIFFTARMNRVFRSARSRDYKYVPPLLRDFADLKARIIVAVKNIDAPMLRVCGKNLNIVSMCAVSPVVYTSKISSSRQKNFFSFPVAVNNFINVGPLVFLL
jgi:hypothetical protein